MSDNSLTTEQLAARWDVTPETLARWRADAIGPPFFKVLGRRVKYRLEDIELYESESMRSSTADTDRIPSNDLRLAAQRGDVIATTRGAPA
ncbi:helix-turn-helix transcriptional regulator [Lysobacter enzymogenes]|uniref:helix-turn-helix transcriptional regulator n=1 Tax=Lysobacter enzymogenes TaxID=69 RepID=UPI0009C74BFC|nr:helix-turn-helix domain-containing protein [Lysobacter enzymogenes]UZW61816.1 helix-turn-helix domain-containing protein [Lysobacter enzymogenes]